MSIRPIRESDLDELLELCAEHAEYERCAFERQDQAEKWRRAIEAGRLWVWVAEGEKDLEGFAAVSLEYSTWRAEEYLHLDCLYVREAARGHGWGSKLLSATLTHAQESGCREMQWQTPPWNEKAIAFYTHKGASSHPKQRFSLSL